MNIDLTWLAEMARLAYDHPVATGVYLVIYVGWRLAAARLNAPAQGAVKVGETGLK